MPRSPRQNRQRGIDPDGPALRQWREELRLSQETVSFDADVNVKTVQRAEAGERIDKESFERIAKALDKYAARLVADAPGDVTPSPAARRKQRLRFIGTIDVPEEMIEVFRREKVALKLFILLHMLELACDGALNIEVAPGSVLIAADLTKDDIETISLAFLNGELRWLGFKAITVEYIDISARLMHLLRSKHTDRDIAIHTNRLSGISTQELANTFALEPQSIFVIVGRVNFSMKQILESLDDPPDLLVGVLDELQHVRPDMLRALAELDTP